MAEIPLLNFDKDGALVGELPRPNAATTDVVLISHGWNEQAADAIQHYQDLVTPLQDILSQNAARWQGRKVEYFGVIWPSAKYADDLTIVDMQMDADSPLVPPAAAASMTALNDEKLQLRAQEVAVFIGARPDLIVGHALGAANNDDDRNALVIALRSAAASRQASADQQTKIDHAALFDEGKTGSDIFSEIHQEFLHLSSVVANTSDNPLIGWLKRLRSDANAKVAYLLNLFAYNEMKIRAGRVGEGLAAQAVNPFVSMGKSIHLVGHSFGGRVMTAVAARVQSNIHNLTLLEGAFSHNALSVDPKGPIEGAFKNVIDDKKVTGRITAAHSNHDAAVWVAYPLASNTYRDSYSLRPSGIPARGLFGGPTDRYGAMGANGPQNLDNVRRASFDGKSVPDLAVGVHALDCSSFVAGHSDVWKKGSSYIVAAGLLPAEAR